ncbi:MAG: 3-phosphoserine/phosphohydroxythreonine transaminase [Bacteroidota bacterium]|nr:3-phosphoserine/phosphohydroxythreonine transaminase [Bacteroidota bacterium]
MERAHNFFAGPAVLPLPVVEETRDAVLDFANLGVSIMEVSHRSKEFDAVMLETQKDALDIMGLSADEYACVFLGGGASLQFAMVPMNFLAKKADYVITGEWATKAFKEAKIVAESVKAEAVKVASSEEANFTYIPKELKWSPDADYAHITTNNTIYGTQWRTTPDVGAVPLVADMSSDMLSRPLDFSKYSLIYAGAQKNLGPAGVTMIIVRKAWVEEKARKDLPTMLKYKTHVDKGSMFNTPPVLPVFVVGRTLKWIRAMGGLEAIGERNEKKAKMIYDVIDAYPEFYRGTVKNPEDRSRMNITWNLPTPELEDLFVSEAKKRRMLGLKGHRSVGGCRASVYNSCPMESVEALVKFMEEFYRAHK